MTSPARRRLVAIGNVAEGTIAIGNVAHGTVAIGFSLSVGVVAVGINAVGSVAAFGINAVAPIAVSAVNGIGVFALAGVNGIGGFGAAGVNAGFYPPVGVAIAAALFVSSLIARKKMNDAQPSPEPAEPACVRVAALEMDRDAYVRATVFRGARGLVLREGDAEARAELVAGVELHARDFGKTRVFGARLETRSVGDAAYRAPDAERVVVVTSIVRPPGAAAALRRSLRSTRTLHVGFALVALVVSAVSCALAMLS